MNRFFGRKMTWLMGAGAVIMALAFVFSYLGALLNPERNTENFPMGVVNLDQGISILGTSQNQGDTLVATLQQEATDSGSKIIWTVYDDRDALVNALEHDEIYGGVVVSESFTQDLAGIFQPLLTGGQSRQAQAEILYNHGGGSIAGVNSERILNQVEDTMQQTARDGVLSRVGETVNHDQVPLLSVPIDFTHTDVVPAPENSGVGMGAFYMAVVTIIGGFLAMTVCSMGVDFIAGHSTFGPRLEKWRGEPIQSTIFHMYGVKVLLFLMVVLVASIIETVFALRYLDLPVSGWATAWGLAFLGMTTAGMISAFFVAFLSTPGILVSLIFTTILGIPSSYGIFPREMVPDGYKYLGEILPVRYLTDAFRSVVYFGGAGDVGLNRGVVVLLAYAIGAGVLGAVGAWISTKQRAKHAASKAGATAA